jgi:hypothetical protein
VNCRDFPGWQGENRWNSLIARLRYSKQLQTALATYEARKIDRKTLWALGYTSVSKIVKSINAAAPMTPQPMLAIDNFFSLTV